MRISENQKFWIVLAVGVALLAAAVQYLLKYF
jgi:hypothetical protein